MAFIHSRWQALGRPSSVCRRSGMGGERWGAVGRGGRVEGRGRGPAVHVAVLAIQSGVAGTLLGAGTWAGATSGGCVTQDPWGTQRESTTQCGQMPEWKERGRSASRTRKPTSRGTSGSRLAMQSRAPQGDLVLSWAPSPGPSLAISRVPGIGIPGSAPSPQRMERPPRQPASPSPPAGSRIGHRGRFVRVGRPGGGGGHIV